MIDVSRMIEDALSSFGGQSTAVGLSIGSSSVKLVELKKSGKAWKLIHFGVAQLPENSISNREIVNPIAVVESIKSLTQQIKLKSKNVATGVSGNSVIVKRMTMEVQNPKELRDQVFWEAEQYLPFDVSEVIMDFETLKKSKDGKTDVILVAAKKNVVETYMSCIEDSGLKAKIVDVDFFAMQSVFEANYSPGSDTVGIVDVGASSLKLAIVYSGIPVFVKDSAVGGANLTSEIQRALNLSFLDAETLKLGGGPQGKMPQEVSDLMHGMSENLASEIKRAIDFYNASSFGPPMNYCLLTGGSSVLPGLSKMVEDTIGLPTQLMNPFNSITVDSSVFSPEYLSSVASIASLPIGLALRMGSK